MPKIINYNDQRAHIRRAALEVLVRDGSVRGLGCIAAQAGMKRANLYTYYPDRQALLDDVAGTLLNEEEQIFASALNAEGCAAEKILHLVNSVCDRFSEWAQMGVAILQIWAHQPERIQHLLSTLREALTQMIEAAQTDGQASKKYPARHCATLVIALIDGLMLQLFLNPDDVPDAGEMHAVMVETIRSLVGLDRQDGAAELEGHVNG